MDQTSGSKPGYSMKIEAIANITCPECGHTAKEEMPESY